MATGTPARTESRPRLSRHQARALLDAAPNSNARLLFALEWLAGLSVSEALAIRPRDIDVDGGALSAGHGKTRRRVPLSPELLAIVDWRLRDPYLAPVPATDPIIGVSRQSAAQWIKSAANTAGLDPKPCNHDLRHAYARDCIDRGVTARELQGWLGLASPRAIAEMYLGSG